MYAAEWGRFSFFQTANNFCIIRGDGYFCFIVAQKRSCHLRSENLLPYTSQTRKIPREHYYKYVVAKFSINPFRRSEGRNRNALSRREKWQSALRSNLPSKSIIRISWATVDCIAIKLSTRCSIFWFKLYLCSCETRDFCFRLKLYIFAKR